MLAKGGMRSTELTSPTRKMLSEANGKFWEEDDHPTDKESLAKRDAEKKLSIARAKAAAREAREAEEREEFEDAMRARLAEELNAAEESRSGVAEEKYGSTATGGASARGESKFSLTKSLDNVAQQMAHAGIDHAAIDEFVEHLRSRWSLLVIPRGIIAPFVSYTSGRVG